MVIDPNEFETEMKYFCEWFNQNAEKNKNKMEFFYGPYSENQEWWKKTNKLRIERIKR